MNKDDVDDTMWLVSPGQVSREFRELPRSILKNSREFA